DAALDAWLRPRLKGPHDLHFLRSDAGLRTPWIGPALRRAVPSLRERLGDPSLEVRVAAARWLWLVEDEPSRASLVSGLWKGMVLPPLQPSAAAGAKLADLVERVGYKRSDGRDEGDFVKELNRLARLGPAA